MGGNGAVLSLGFLALETENQEAVHEVTVPSILPFPLRRVPQA